VIVVDANILIRAVLGKKVRALLRRYVGTCEFVAPVLVFREARENLPHILRRRSFALDTGLASLDSICGLVSFIEPKTCGLLESRARKRLFLRDDDDWPIVATALLVNYPIWIEDTDFFGCGVATWTSDRVEIYLAQSAA